MGLGGGGGGRYQEGEECGVAESSATEEYFRVVANHLPALRPMIGGRRIPNSTAKQQSIHGNVQARCRHATLLSIASSDDLCLQGKSYLLICTYTYNHCAYFIHERHNTTATTTTTTTTTTTPPTPTPTTTTNDSSSSSSSSSSNCSKGTLAQRLPYGGRRAERTSRNPRKKDKLV